MTKNETDYFLDGCDTPPNIHLTTSQRIDMAAAAAAFKVSESVRGGFKDIETKVQALAEKWDKANGKHSKWGGLFRDLARLVVKRIGEEKLD